MVSGTKTGFGDLAQVAVDAKSNAIDAMGCQRAIAEKIVVKKAETTCWR